MFYFIFLINTFAQNSPPKSSNLFHIFYSSQFTNLIIFLDLYIPIIHFKDQLILNFILHSQFAIFKIISQILMNFLVIF